MKKVKWASEEKLQQQSTHIKFIMFFALLFFLWVVYILTEENIRKNAAEPHINTVKYDLASCIVHMKNFRNENKYQGDWLQYGELERSYESTLTSIMHRLTRNPKNSLASKEIHRLQYAMEKIDKNQWQSVIDRCNSIQDKHRKVYLDYRYGNAKRDWED